MVRTTVGVLRGGTSGEYDLSLKTGAAVLNALPDETYQTRDIFIDKRGYWHLRGVPVTATRALSQVDVVVNALHGGVGEDGSVQRILEQAGVPYTGARPLAAHQSLNKARAYEIFKKAGIRIPQTIVFSVDDALSTGEMAEMVFAEIAPPYVVKPAGEGASRGIEIAMSFSDLPDTLGDVLDAFGTVIVQHYISGREATVGVIEDFRGQELYVLPPAEVIIPDGSIFVESTHHDNALLRHNVPSTFGIKEKEALMTLARLAHRALELSHFSRADFIVTPSAAYLLEVNAIPGLYQGAAFPAMLESVGSSVREFIEHSISLART